MTNKPSIASVTVKKHGQTQATLDVRMQEKKQRKDIDKKVAIEVDKLKGDYKEQIRKQKQQIDKLKKKSMPVSGDIELTHSESVQTTHTIGQRCLVFMNAVFLLFALLWVGGVLKDFISLVIPLDFAWYLLITCSVINIAMYFKRKN